MYRQEAIATFFCSMAEDVLGERVAGRFLADMPKNKGGRPPKTCSTVEQVSPPSLAELGVARKHAIRAVCGIGTSLKSLGIMAGAATAATAASMVGQAAATSNRAVFKSICGKYREIN